jgi:hypothetical protein
VPLTETVRQNDTEAGELVQNQGESSITESRCTEEFELNAVIPDPNVIGQWCVIHYMNFSKDFNISGSICLCLFVTFFGSGISDNTSSNLYQIQFSTNPQKNWLFPMEHMQLTSGCEFITF